MRSPVADLLADLAAALRSVDIDWYLFGAQAAILHGAARLTADVDVAVRLPAAMSHEALAEVLERHGFERRFRDPQFTAQTRVAANRDTLDLSYVEQTLTMLEDALGQSDLRPLLRQILAGG